MSTIFTMNEVEVLDL